MSPPLRLREALFLAMRCGSIEPSRCSVVPDVEVVDDGYKRNLKSLDFMILFMKLMSSAEYYAELELLIVVAFLQVLAECSIEVSTVPESD